jgi:hypothetical protein
MEGGKFEHGFFSGFVSSLGGSFMQTYGTSMNAGTQVIMSAAIGGTAEALGGGKFANGAVTGAYVMMFNHLMHGDGSLDFLKDSENSSFCLDNQKRSLHLYPNEYISRCT